MWGLPFLKRVTECESALPMASDCRYGASEESHVRGTWSRERECGSYRPKIPLCCTLLESIFRNVIKDASACGRCFNCDGGISSQRCFELVPFVGAELHLSAWHQVCCRFHLGLLGPMLQSHPPRDEEGDLMGRAPVARNTLLIDSIQVDRVRRGRDSLAV